SWTLRRSATSWPESSLRSAIWTPIPPRASENDETLTYPFIGGGRARPVAAPAHRTAQAAVRGHTHPPQGRQSGKAVRQAAASFPGAGGNLERGPAQAGVGERLRPGDRLARNDHRRQQGGDRRHLRRVEARRAERGDRPGGE